MHYRLVFQLIVAAATLSSVCQISNGQEPLYDNLALSHDELIFPDPGDTFAAQSFITDGSGSVASVEIPLRRVGDGPSGGSLKFSIWGDDGAGSPDSLIEALSPLAAEEIKENGLHTLTGPVVGLEPDSTYHFIVDVRELVFDTENRFVFETVASSDGTNGGGNLKVAIPEWTNLNNLLGAGASHLQMAVNPVPEPSASLLATIAGLGLLLASRSRVNRKTLGGIAATVASH